MRIRRVNVRRGILTGKTWKPYLKETAALYDKGEYEEALAGMERLASFKSVMGAVLVPYIYRCKRLIDVHLTQDDRRHMKNQELLKHFGWIGILKWCTGVASIFPIASLVNTLEEGWFGTTSFVIGTILVFVTYSIHRFMRKFTESRPFIRCKSCGHYTHRRYPGPEWRSCGTCGRWYMPVFINDGWSGMEWVIEGRGKPLYPVPDDQHIHEYKYLKNMFSAEYMVWNNMDKSDPEFAAQLRKLLGDNLGKNSAMRHSAEPLTGSAIF